MLVELLAENAHDNWALELRHAEDTCARLTRSITHEAPLAPTLEAATVRVRKMRSRAERRR